MSEGTQYTGGYVDGRCYVEKAVEDGPPLYSNGDFHFQGTPHQWYTVSLMADSEIHSPPSKTMFRLRVELC